MATQPVIPQPPNTRIPQLTFTGTLNYKGLGPVPSDLQATAAFMSRTGWVALDGTELPG